MNRSKGKVILAGGSGFLGQALATYLGERGYEPIILTRSPNGTSPYSELLWDGQTPGDWVESLAGATALINLVGKSVDCRYTAENRRVIIQSRVDSVHALTLACQQLGNPPPVWIQATSLAIYGDRGDELLTEEATSADGFSPTVCREWEAAFLDADLPGIRKITLRISFVLGRGGGALSRLTRLASIGLGGTIGPGTQYMSWIHEEDFCRLVLWALEHPQVQGIYNTTSPNPATNKDFMRALRQAVGVPFGIPCPAPLVHFGSWVLRTEAELALKGRRGVPARLHSEGFEFRWTDLDKALADAVS